MGLAALHGDEDLDPRLQDAWADACARAGELADVPPVDVDLAPLREAAALLYEGPWLAERLLAVRPAVDAGLDGLDPVVASIVRDAAVPDAVALFAARHRLQELRAQVRALFATIDVLVVPTAPTVPTPREVADDPVGLNRRMGRFTNAVNLLDLAAVALPAGRGAEGVPFGVTLIAPAFSEGLLLQLGRRFAGEPDAADGPPVTRAGEVELAVVGAHLRGQPLEHQLRDRGARFLRDARSSAGYRLYALPGGPPQRPGLVRHGDGAAPDGGIALEVWAMPVATLGDLLVQIPAPLGLGRVALADGTTALGFLCEAHAVEDARDITGFGGWRAFLDEGPRAEEVGAGRER